jgi:hypothetical protein
MRGTEVSRATRYHKPKPDTYSPYIDYITGEYIANRAARASTEITSQFARVRVPLGNSMISCIGGVPVEGTEYYVSRFTRCLPST